jgi:hypothetical protein
MCNALVQAFEDIGGQFFRFSDDAETDVVLHQRVFFYRVHQQAHQGRHLFGGAFPVLGGEGVKGQVFDAQPCRFLGYGVYRLCASLMPVRTSHAALLRPPPVAVHDNGDVRRYP